MNVSCIPDLIWLLKNLIDFADFGDFWVWDSLKLLDLFGHVHTAAKFGGQFTVFVLHMFSKT